MGLLHFSILPTTLHHSDRVPAGSSHVYMTVSCGPSISCSFADLPVTIVLTTAHTSHLKVVDSQLVTCGMVLHCILPYSDGEAVTSVNNPCWHCSSVVRTECDDMRVLCNIELHHNGYHLQHKPHSTTVLSTHITINDTTKT